jgi:hypothetical protein
MPLLLPLPDANAPNAKQCDKACPLADVTSKSKIQASRCILAYENKKQKNKNV